jgi:hypothetical protein
VSPQKAFKWKKLLFFFTSLTHRSKYYEISFKARHPVGRRSSRRIDGFFCRVRWQSVRKIFLDCQKRSFSDGDRAGWACSYFPEVVNNPCLRFSQGACNG